MLRATSGAVGNASITGGTITGLSSLALSTGAVTSGRYTPTLTNSTNVASSGALSCHYTQIGAEVTVSGRCTIDPTSATTLTAIGISLPVASNLAATEDLTGNASCDAFGYVGSCYADTSNDRAILEFQCGSTVTNGAWAFMFTYQVL